MDADGILRDRVTKAAVTMPLGLQCWHARVELDGDRGTVCMDRSRGQDDTMWKVDYYDLGKLEHVTRYTHAETVALLRTGTVGPWL